MDNIATQLLELNDIKNDISTAITNRGKAHVESFRDYPSYLSEIYFNSFCWPDNVKLQYSSAYPDWRYIYTGSTTNLSGLYQNCTDVSILDLRGMVVSNVTSMLDMFNGCTNLQTVILPDGFGRQCSKVINIANFFSGCTSLTALPDGLKNLDCSSCIDIGGFFAKCSGLSGTLDLSGWKNLQNITRIPHTFNNDGQNTGATTINLSGWNPTSVDTLEGMFYMNTVVENINMSWTTTSSCTNIVGLFLGCSNLRSVDLSGCDFSNAGMWRTFYQCSRLESVYITNEGTLNKLTNNLSSQGSNYIPSSATIYYNDSQYKWQNNQWTLQ